MQAMPALHTHSNQCKPAGPAPVQMALSGPAHMQYEPHCLWVCPQWLLLLSMLVCVSTGLQPDVDTQGLLEGQSASAGCL